MLEDNVSHTHGIRILSMHPLPLSFCAHVRLNKKYWSEPRKHDRKIKIIIRHRAATANKLVDIVVVAAVVTAIALAAAVSFLSL